MKVRTWIDDWKQRKLETLYDTKSLVAVNMNKRALSFTMSGDRRDLGLVNGVLQAGVHAEVPFTNKFIEPLETEGFRVDRLKTLSGQQYDVVICMYSPNNERQGYQMMDVASVLLVLEGEESFPSLNPTNPLMGLDMDKKNGILVMCRRALRESAPSKADLLQNEVEQVQMDAETERALAGLLKPCPNTPNLSLIHISEPTRPY